MEGPGLHPKAKDGEDAGACAARNNSANTTPRNSVHPCGACPGQVYQSNLIISEEYFVSGMAPEQSLANCDVEEMVCNPARNSAASGTSAYDLPPGMVPAEDKISTSKLTAAPTNMMATLHPGKKPVPPGGSPFRVVPTPTSSHVAPSPHPRQSLSVFPAFDDTALATDIGLDIATQHFNLTLSAQYLHLVKLLPLAQSCAERHLEVIRMKKMQLKQQRTAKPPSPVDVLSPPSTGASSQWQSSASPSPSPASFLFPPSPLAIPLQANAAPTPHVETHLSPGGRLTSAAKSSTHCLERLRAASPSTATRRAPTMASLQSQLDLLQKLKPGMNASVQRKVASLTKMREELNARRTRHSAACMPVRKLEDDLASPTPGKAVSTSTPPLPLPIPLTSSHPNAPTDQPAPPSPVSVPTDYDFKQEIYATVKAAMFDADPRDLIRSLQGSPYLQPAGLTVPLHMAATSNACSDMVDMTTDSKEVDGYINCIADNVTNSHWCLTATTTCTEDDLEDSVTAHDTTDERVSVQSFSSSHTNHGLPRAASTISDVSHDIKSFALYIEQDDDIDCDTIDTSNDKPAHKKAKGIKGCWKAFARTCGKAARAVKKVAKGACSCLAPSQ